MKKLKPWLIIVSIVVVLTLLKVFFFPSEKAKAEKGSKDGVIPVTVFVTGDSALVENVYASGTLVANEQVDLRAQTNGSIVYLYFPEGKVVTEGTLLLKVNDADIKAQYEKIIVQLNHARKEELRQRTLLKERAISQQEYEVSQTNYKGLLADSAYYKAQLDKTEVRAPFTGVLGIKNVSVGGYVTPTIILGQIHQLDPIKIDFSLPEKYSSSIHVGDVVKFNTDGRKQYQAKIIVRDPAIDLTSRTVRYRALCENSKGELLPGSFVRIQIFVEDQSESLFIPTESIVPVLKGKKAFVINAGVAQERMVETGFRTADHIQILSGLKAGDSVVVNGSNQLKDGNKVKVVKGKKNLQAVKN